VNRTAIPIARTELADCQNWQISRDVVRRGRRRNETRGREPRLPTESRPSREERETSLTADEIVHTKRSTGTRRHAPIRHHARRRLRITRASSSAEPRALGAPRSLPRTTAVTARRHRRRGALRLDARAVHARPIRALAADELQRRDSSQARPCSESRNGRPRSAAGGGRSRGARSTGGKRVVDERAGELHDDRSGLVSRAGRTITRGRAGRE